MTADSDLQRAAVALGVVWDVPQVLAYSIVAPLLFLGALAVPYVVVVTVRGLSPLLFWLATLPAMFLCSFFVAVVQVATCYEVNEAFAGRQPTPLAGFRVALGRPKRILLAAGLTVAAVQFQRYLGGFGRLGESIAEAGGLGYQVVSTVAFPLIATTDSSAAETVEDLLRSVEATWDRGLAVAVGTKTLGFALFWGALALGVTLTVAAVFGVGFSVPPLGTFTLPLVVVACGGLLAFSIPLLIRSILATALLRYLRHGEFPMGSEPELVLTRTADGN